MTMIETPARPLGSANRSPRRVGSRGRSRTQLLVGVSLLAGACALWMPPPPADLRPATAADTPVETPRASAT
jgi:hypothetical protein